MVAANLPDAVSKAVAAANNKSLEAFLNTFAPGGSVDDWGRVFTGRNQIARWSDAEFIGKNVTLLVREAVVKENSTEVQATVGGDGFTGPSTFIFDLADGKVTRMTIRG